MNNSTSAGNLSPCPCCGSFVIEEPGCYEICDICGWEDDPVQSRNEFYIGGANGISLKEAKNIWAKKSARM